MPVQTLAIARGSVPTANARGQRGELEPFRFGRGYDPSQWEFEVTRDVFVEGFEWRDVKNVDALGTFRESPEMVEAAQKRGKCLARAGGGKDQCVPAIGDRGPALNLGRGRIAVRSAKPFAHDREEPVESVIGICHRSEVAPCGKATPIVRLEHPFDKNYLNGCTQIVKTAIVTPRAERRQPRRDRSCCVGWFQRSDHRAWKCASRHLPRPLEVKD